jgi:hypothetical protein
MAGPVIGIDNLDGHVLTARGQCTRNTWILWAGVLAYAWPAYKAYVMFRTLRAFSTNTLIDCMRSLYGILNGSRCQLHDGTYCESLRLM